jgi:ABC-2 type transport system ATP-binding protein
MSDQVIVAQGLVKDHFSNLLRKRFRALHGIDFSVARGEAFGLLGPNGAGKTTTQKLLLGLLKPTEGSVSVLGYPAGDRNALKRIGYLPENPYFYSYLTAGEFLDFFGRLFSLSKSQRRQRSRELLEMVSLGDVGDRPIRKFSKGMLQRLGIAQALINDPELVFLDEPNSGLDPVGRRDIRQIIMKLKQQGKTIFLNSHLLPDVNELCDRIMILHRGRCVAAGSVHEISASGNYHDLEEYFMEAIRGAEQRYQEELAQQQQPREAAQA